VLQVRPHNVSVSELVTDTILLRSQISWSNVRACVFFVLTGDALRTEGLGPLGGAVTTDDQLTSGLQVWDLAQNVEEPIIRSEVPSPSGAPVGAFAISQYARRFEGRHPYAAFVDDSGEIQLHVFKKGIAIPKGDERAALGTFYETCPNPAVPSVPKISASSEKNKVYRREIGYVVNNCMICSPFLHPA